MVVWAVFNIFLPLSSVGLIVFGSWIANGQRKSVFSIVKDGQICFYCVAVLGTLLYDITRISSVPENREYVPYVISFLILAMIFSTYIYSIAVFSSRFHAHPNIVY